MIKQLLRISAAIFSGAVLTLHAAIDPTLNWYSIESEHMIVHYADGYKTRAEKALLIAEQVHDRQTQELDWSPVEKTHVVLSDETDYPNGYATPFFFNHTVLFLAPPTSVDTLEDFDDWFTTLITHEYLHIIHLDKSDGSPEYLRNIFGRFFFLFPNVFQPSWVTEGLAVYKETDLIRGIGRGQSTLYEVMMREEVLRGLQPVDHVNLPVATWPAGTTRYLYGSYFMNYIAHRQSEEDIHNWVQGYSNNLLPFFINTNANQTLGANLTPLWKDYSEWLAEKFIAQIEQIEQQGLKQGTAVSDDAYQTNSVVVQGKDVYFVRNNGYSQAALVHIDSEGDYQEITELNSSAKLDIHQTQGILLSQQEYCNRYHIYNDLYVYKLETKNLQRLTRCARYISASWFPDGSQIAAVHHDGGNMALHRLNRKGEVLEVLWKADDGEILGAIDISATGEALVAAVWRKTYGWNIEQFSFKNKRWLALTSGTAIESSPRYTPDGNILFSHEANHAYNLYLYNTRDGKVSQISNVLGAAFQASQGEEGGPIYYTGYTAEGHGVFRLDDISPLKRAEVSSDTVLLSYDYKLADHEQYDYSPWPSLSPRFWFPRFGFSEQRAPIGLSTAGADALGFHNYSISTAWDFKLDALDAIFSYAYTDRLFFNLSRTYDIAVDANGDTAYTTARDIAGVTLAFPYRKKLSRHNLLAGIFYDREHEFSQGTAVTPIPSSEDNLLGLAWLYNSTKVHPLSISKNDGLSLRLVAEDSDLLTSDYTGQVYTLDWKQYIRTGQESLLALRFVQGWGTDSPRKFQLGGESVGINALSLLIDGQQENVFNQRKYPLRGYKEGQRQLQGRRTQLLTAEWRFPIQRNESGIMTPPVGLMQWSGSIFTEAGAAYQDSPSIYYGSAGIEINADINLFYGANIRFRAGYAHGFDSQIGEDRVYLTAGSIF